MVFAVDICRIFISLITSEIEACFKYTNHIQHKETAEDITIDSLMYYWENRHTLAPDSNIPAYIMEVVKHKCLNHLRNQRVREDIELSLQNHQDRVRKLKITSLEACGKICLAHGSRHIIIFVGRCCSLR